MNCELRLNASACGAIFTIDRCFHDDAAGRYHRRIGNFQMDIAISRVRPRQLYESMSHVEQLQLAATARSIRSRLSTLWKG